jgi:transcription elongation factor Elf1
VDFLGYRRLEMADREEKERQYVKDSKESKKPEICPKCGSKKITSCPGGSSLKAVPGIWWICDDCKHQW